ncbi:hypothetical protein NKOR_06000 [Candidatus Nitrosopumilus koreensis AR1]|uniref:Uncharacterized protein n=1 Tax=Candidatus Nitrosopumilus koreensis AR1 TaxID=1229908 RepID=K0B4J1_9ARCH|nr:MULTISPECIES: hypothetical protein [Nitrosopumilus]AFS81083.1 hypothetical protein NKOR_06000 [Candidatus Nitrosopumilus koreensis AR1]
MEKFFDPEKSYLSCEKNIKQYLKALSDSQLKTFFENLEYTPFPILLMKEYKKRFRKSGFK